MKATLTAAYSAAVYLFFLMTFLYAIGFVGGFVVPKAIDDGPAGPWATALVVDLALLTVFAVQHSAMARPGFKRLWTKLVPPAAERSTYVLAASLALALMFWQWRPLPQAVWSIEGPAAALVRGASFVGWALVLISTCLISHFHLFGLSQGFARLLGRRPSEAAFTTPMFYRVIRHPIYAGFILAFWAEPRMSLGHLIFAGATTGYILVGIWLEERDLVAQFGQRYLDYRRRVGMLTPRLRRPAS